MGGRDNFEIIWGDTAVMRGDIELMGGNPGLTAQLGEIMYTTLMYSEFLQHRV